MCRLVVVSISLLVACGRLGFAPEPSDAGPTSGDVIADTVVVDGATCTTGCMAFTAAGTFVLPTPFTTFKVEAFGGGGGAGQLHQGTAAADGGRGGYAVRSFMGQTPGTSYTITIGLGGSCESAAMTAGGYVGGRGGNPNSAGGAGGGAAAGGTGGIVNTGPSPGGAGGSGNYGGGGGGGGGDTILGNAGGGATTFQLTTPLTDLVIAGGGGGAGTSDQNGNRAGIGGAACAGYNGMSGGNGLPNPSEAGSGGGGGACFCMGGTCDLTPRTEGSAGGVAGTNSNATGGTCTSAQKGADGKILITYP